MAKRKPTGEPIIVRYDGVRFRIGDRIRWHDSVGAVKDICNGDLYVWWDEDGDHRPTLALSPVNPWMVQHINVLDEMARIPDTTDEEISRRLDAGDAQ